MMLSYGILLSICLSKKEFDKNGCYEVDIKINILIILKFLISNVLFLTYAIFFDITLRK